MCFLITWLAKEHTIIHEYTVYGLNDSLERKLKFIGVANFKNLVAGYG